MDNDTFALASLLMPTPKVKSPLYANMLPQSFHRTYISKAATKIVSLYYHIINDNCEREARTAANATIFVSYSI